MTNEQQERKKELLAQRTGELLNRMRRAGLLRSRSTLVQGRMDRAVVRAQQEAHVLIDVRSGKPCAEEDECGANEVFIEAPDRAFVC